MPPANAKSPDRFKRVKQLGQGAFGRALLVEDPSDGKKKVCKEIEMNKMPKQEKDAALQEAKLLGGLHHPNVVSCHEHFQREGKLCIIMDYCSRGDLYTLLKAQKGHYLPEETVIDYFVQICLGVKHMHDRKILHRDLKTSNIFLTHDGYVKVGDMGVSKVLSGTQQLAYTAVGTPYYLSPEICENKPYSSKSDIWSLGCVLYEMATLRHAFDADTLKLLVLKILRGIYPPLPNSFSKDLRDLVANMLQKDANRRPSINQILGLSWLHDRAQKCLPPDIVADEFSHTVLHGKPKPGALSPPRERPPTVPEGNEESAHPEARSEAQAHQGQGNENGKGFNRPGSKGAAKRPQQDQGRAGSGNEGVQRRPAAPAQQRPKAPGGGEGRSNKAPGPKKLQPMGLQPKAAAESGGEHQQQGRPDAEERRERERKAREARQAEEARERERKQRELQERRKEAEERRRREREKWRHEFAQRQAEARRNKEAALKDLRGDHVEVHAPARQAELHSPPPGEAEEQAEPRGEVNRPANARRKWEEPQESPVEAAGAREKGPAKEDIESEERRRVFLENKKQAERNRRKALEMASEGEAGGNDNDHVDGAEGGGAGHQQARPAWQEEGQASAEKGVFVLNGEEVKLPGVVDHLDGVAGRIEALRMLLEHRLGLERFKAAYEELNGLRELDDEQAAMERVKGILGRRNEGYLSLIHQLIVCEDSFYESS